MAKLSDEVKNFVQNARGLDNAKQAADEWYRTVGKSSGDKSIQSSGSPFQPGKIYIFRYEHPKTMERLEQWDANPVVLSLGRIDSSDVGINLNYLPYKAKLQILDKIYKSFLPKIEEQQAKAPAQAKKQKPILSFDANTILAFLNKAGLGYAIKRYVTNLRKSTKVVSAEGWKYVPLLDLAQIKKTDIRKVQSGYSKYINKKK
jgi:hypothetical protein